MEHYHWGEPTKKVLTPNSLDIILRLQLQLQQSKYELPTSSVVDKDIMFLEDRHISLEGQF